MKIIEVFLKSAVIVCLAFSTVYGEMQTCYSSCVMEEVTCTCHPSLRIFIWVIQNNNGFLTTIPFADSHNGTIQVRERYSTEALVFYNEDNVITSFLTFTAHPELHGATITCDQYSITFNILDLFRPTLILSSGGANTYFEVNIKLSSHFTGLSHRNYTVETRTALRNVLVKSIPADISIDNNEFYIFRIQNKMCSLYEQTNVVQYPMLCAFMKRDSQITHMIYTINSQNTTVLLTCGSGHNSTMQCGADGMWHGNNICANMSEMSLISSLSNENLTFNTEELGSQTLKIQVSFFTPLLATSAISVGLILFLIGIIVIMACALGLQQRKKSSKRLDHNNSSMMSSCVQKIVWCQDNSAYSSRNEAMVEASMKETNRVYDTIISPKQEMDNDGEKSDYATIKGNGMLDPRHKININ